jgi:hypothetical protein
VLVVSVLRAEVGKSPECLIDKEEFLAWREWKNWEEEKRR